MTFKSIFICLSTVVPFLSLNARRHTRNTFDLDNRWNNIVMNTHTIINNSFTLLKINNNTLVFCIDTRQPLVTVIELLEMSTTR